MRVKRETPGRARALAIGALLALRAVSVDGTAPRSTRTDEAVTFSRDIAPILFARCAGCHRPGGDAPMPLLTYQQARPWARAIATEVTTREMPPWKPEPGFGEFVGERRLTSREIGLIERWVAEGAAAGDPADLPPAPRASEGWQHGDPDLVVRLPEFVLRAEGGDVFRNFVVALPVTETRYVRGLELRPGSRVVHHANLRLDPTSASRRLDERDPEPGYDGMILRSADYPEGHFLGWTPGQAAPLAPPDLAWRLNPGTDLVVQLHMRPDGNATTLRPTIGLFFARDAPTRTPSILRLGRQTIDIAPGATNYRTSDSYVLPVDVEVHAIQPHAHARAREVQAWATLPDGARRPLIAIRRWDVHWQDQYRYAAPFWLPAGTRLDMEYVFDNADTNPRNPDRPVKRVMWGWRSSDEMGDVWVQVMTRSEEDRRRLDRDVRRKMAEEDAIGSEAIVRREPDHVDLRNDAAQLSLELGRPDAALRHFEAVRRLEPQSAAARYNVGIALEAAGRVADAMRRYEEALDLDPEYSVAHNNLGTLLLAARRVEQARHHFERAVETGPNNAEAHNNLGGLLVAFGEVDRATTHLENALRLRPVYPEAHFNLGRAYASAGRLDEAIRMAALGEQEARSAGKQELGAQIREQLRLYRARVERRN
jgi:tetratricopeptide (TPR) repeat protein/mono/diheme cytochrome c family protein